MTVTQRAMMVSKLPDSSIQSKSQLTLIERAGIICVLTALRAAMVPPAAGDRRAAPLAAESGSLAAI